MKKVIHLTAAVLFTITVYAQKKLTFTVPDLYKNATLEIEYKGEIVNGMANGKGVAKDGKEVIYDGMWKDNLFQGKGKYVIGHIGGYLVYNGDWEAGKRNGYGECSNPEYANYVTIVTKYIGNWKDDVYSGKGKITMTQNGYAFDLETYDGDWLNGKRNGQGTEMKDGDKWEGEWKNNLMHGKGTLSNINNGQSYVGQWANGKKQGKGTYKWGNGDQYEGDWYIDNKHGKGIYTWNDGKKYDGEWYNNSKHGKATFTFANGDKYVGEFVNDSKEGRGVYSWANGDIYDGEWIKDQRTGNAKYTYPDGRVYTGHFTSGQFDGRGKMVYPDGKTEDGIWAASKFIRLANPTKKINYPDGSFYIGEAVDTTREGKGKLNYASGATYDGEWHDNKRHGQGKMLYSTGGTDEGRYENGEMVYGEMTRPSTYYKGSLKNKKPNGWGIYNSAIKRADGTTASEEYKGEWVDGKRHGNGELTINGCEYIKGVFVDNLIPKDGYHKNLCQGSDEDD